MTYCWRHNGGTACMLQRVRAVTQVLKNTGREHHSCGSIHLRDRVHAPFLSKGLAQLLVDHQPLEGATHSCTHLQQASLPDASDGAQEQQNAQIQCLCCTHEDQEATSASLYCSDKQRQVPACVGLLSGPASGSSALSSASAPPGSWAACKREQFSLQAAPRETASPVLHSCCGHKLSTVHGRQLTLLFWTGCTCTVAAASGGWLSTGGAADDGSAACQLLWRQRSCCSRASGTSCLPSMRPFWKALQQQSTPQCPAR